MKQNRNVPFGEIIEQEWIGMIRAYFQNFDFESEYLPYDGYWSEFDIQRDIVTRLNHVLSKEPGVFVHGCASMRPKSKPEYQESDINMVLQKLRNSRMPDIVVYQRGYERFPMICEIKYSQQNPRYLADIRKIKEMIDKRICDLGYVLILDEEFYIDENSRNRFLKLVEGMIGGVVLLINDRIFNSHKAKASTLR